MHLRFFSVIALAAVVLASVEAAAQPAPSFPNTPTPAPPPGETTTAAAQPPSEPPAEGAIPGVAPETAPALTEPPAPPPCYPACREGFLCSAGECISACNPPCREGELCTAEATCIKEVGAVPPPPPAYEGASQDLPPPPALVEGAHTHDGFMLRFTIGLGGGVMNESYSGDPFGLGNADGEADYTGAGLTFSLDVGGALSDQFTLHGRIARFALFEPSVSVDGGDQGSLNERELDAYMFGGGLTYNIMPLNMYITGVAGLGVLFITDRDGNIDDSFDAQHDAGLALNLDVGKEWWVVPQTGMGVAGRFWFSTGGFSNEFYDADRTFLGFALLFSLTYQ